MGYGYLTLLAGFVYDERFWRMHTCTRIWFTRWLRFHSEIETALAFLFWGYLNGLTFCFELHLGH